VEKGERTTGKKKAKIVACRDNREGNRGSKKNVEVRKGIALKELKKSPLEAIKKKKREKRDTYDGLVEVESYRKEKRARKHKKRVPEAKNKMFPSKRLQQ